MKAQGAKRARNLEKNAVIALTSYLCGVTIPV
jgi:hypothetical protein